MSNKLLRRNLKRISKRKGISYEEAIKIFYKTESLDSLEKNLLWSLQKRSSKIGKNTSKKSKEKRRIRSKRNEFFRNNSKFAGKQFLHVYDPREP